MIRLAETEAGVNGVEAGVNSIENGVNDTEDNVDAAQHTESEPLKTLCNVITENPTATQAWYAEQLGVSKRTISRMFSSLREQGVLVQKGTKRKSNWGIIRKQ